MNPHVHLFLVGYSVGWSIGRSVIILNSIELKRGAYYCVKNSFHGLVLYRNVSLAFYSQLKIPYRK